MKAQSNLSHQSNNGVHEACAWMEQKLEKEGCLYQDDVVDYLLTNDKSSLLKENSAGNQVLGTLILSAFQKATGNSVVWVSPDRYWRYRVKEDEPSRIARG